jgi:hypothetical protein
MKFPAPMIEKIIIYCFIQFIVSGTSFSSFAAEDHSSDKLFTRKECRWAAKWINKNLSYIMGKGIFKKIISKDDFFEVRIGEAWHGLDFGHKGNLLQRLSRAREITGHSPFFRVLDDKTEETVAKISEDAITIILPDEGFFHCLILDEGKINTFY